METANCCVCGVRIYFDDGYHSTLQNDPKKMFFCLNGHEQHFVESVAIKLEKQHKIIDDAKNKIINDLTDKLKLVESRLTCSICRKKFTNKGNLGRHIKRNHSIKKEVK